MVTESVYLSGGVDDNFVSDAREKIRKALSRGGAGCELVIDINSPGGSVFSGLDLFGYIREVSSKGHKVTTIASGYCASMGGVLIQAGDVRAIRKDSYLHLHEAGSMSAGKAADLLDEAQLLVRLTEQMVRIYAERTKMPYQAIYDRITRQEWWLSAEEALEAGFVDVVI
jgi:ATP-dependent protease ClpP protease subunit